ncbi:unnamed protein product [Prorocentrum cordatum]|uniref:Prolyl endopeptidase n=1 Tax=Prorocentrum cordatum TaxID=2364126 RepID=A0ABN9X7P9_9DINO|nr:unnamed protein product [Polarella glacialis]
MVLCYRSRDVLLVSVGLADSVTDCGNPRVVRAWQRGTPLAAAKVTFTGESEDRIVFGYAVRERGGSNFEVVCRAVSFYEAERRISLDQGRSFSRLPAPADAELLFFGEHILLRLGSDFSVPGAPRPFRAGSLLAAPAREALAGEQGCWAPLWEPQDEQAPGAEPGRGTPRSTMLQHVAATRDFLVLVVLSRVRSSLVVFRYPEARGGSWDRVTPCEAGGGAIASLSVRPVDPRGSNALWVGRASYTEPPALFLVQDVGAWAAAGCPWGSSGSEPPAAGEPARLMRRVKQLWPQFEASGMTTTQLEATSRDGTQVPYFVTRGPGHASAGGPTLLYAYGGFDLPVLPRYQGSVGVAWLERGGAYVEANIRGGGEFGPAWSRAARKGGRLRAYEDLEAVADDLRRRGLAAPRRRGLFGRSNGGLLVGNMLARSPERFGALVAEVPLLDMKIYHRLLAGAGWMEEYGDPDKPSEWAELRRISPYHLLADCAHGQKLPPVLFTTSTRDDRVHPCHARKMVRRLQEELPGLCDAYLFESAEGGHSGAASIGGRAFLRALEYDFLWRRLASG